MSFPKVKWNLGTDSGFRTNQTPATALEFALTERANHPRSSSGQMPCDGHPLPYMPANKQRPCTLHFFFGLRSIVIRGAAATRIARGVSTPAGGSNTLETFHGFPARRPALSLVTLLTMASRTQPTASTPVGLPAGPPLFSPPLMPRPSRATLGRRTVLWTGAALCAPWVSSLPREFVGSS